jgi:uncharacterized SAM-binding protein YcdF (DUF218 family)
MAAAPVAAVAGFLLLRKLLKMLIKIILILIVLLAVYFSVTVIQVWLTSRLSEPQRSEAIVIMGSAQYNGVPSPDLLARLQEADALYRMHLAPLVIATGAKEPGDNFTEAQTEATWLERNGVPEGAVRQVGGRTTWQSLSLAATVLKSKGLNQILIVTDAFHEDRCLAISSGFGLQAKPVPASNSPIKGWSAFPYFMKEAAAVAIGRVIGYSHLEWLHDVA